jgi:predicted transcriptional regulator YdeE
MDNFQLTRDIHLCCVKAMSFPEGIEDAHKRLGATLNPDNKYNHFGISYMYDNGILYMAAVEIVNDKEEIPADCDRYTLKKGNYISTYITGFAKDISQVQTAFDRLLDHPAIDEEGCCAECYLPAGTDYKTAKDMRCMVRLAD